MLNLSYSSDLNCELEIHLNTNLKSDRKVEIIFKRVFFSKFMRMLFEAFKGPFVLGDNNFSVVMCEQ